MRSDNSLLSVGFSNAGHLRAQAGSDLLGPRPKRAFVPEPEKIDPCLKGIEACWEDDAFWCPEPLASGFPLFYVFSREARNVHARAVIEAGGDVSWLTFGLEDARRNLYRRPQIVIVPRARGATVYHTDLRPVCRVIRNGSVGSGRKVIDAYTDFVRSPVARTEDCWGVLGAYPWAELDALIAKSTRCSYDAERDRALGGFFRRLWGSRTTSDPGKTAKRDRASRCAAAMRWADAKLWSRDVSFKRRHYYDLATFLALVDEVWGDEAVAIKGGATPKEAALQRESFRRSVRVTLAELVFGPASYERVYLTMFWIFSSRWWPSLVPVLMRIGSLGMADAEYTAIHKEITAVCTSSWMVPGTCRQHQFSANFLNAEDLIGWSDRDSLKGGVCAEIIKFALADFEYRAGVRGGGGNGRSEPPIFGSGGSPVEYLVRYESAMYDLLRPMYAKYSSSMSTLSAHLDKRMAWMAGGAVGRRAKELLGPQIAPAGSSKAYAASRAEKSLLVRDWGEMHIEVGGKGNEKGAERTLLATDLRDQVGESYLLHAFKNRYGLIGVDVGETPTEMFKRHVTIAAATEQPKYYRGFDAPVLAAWDYSKWDHHVMLAERLCLCRTMRRLINEYVQDHQVRQDMLSELQVIEDGHTSAIYRSRAYADEKYARTVDDLVRAGKEGGFKGTVERLSADRLRITNYAGQQSGRRSTLESNTFYSRARLLVRDAELMPGERSIYLLNRADDVLELYRSWLHARNAIDVMLLQGQKANPKKQVVQCRSGVYFRILYAFGSMRGFPARAVYASATAGPAMAATGGFDPIERLVSVSGALDRLARRGTGYWLARHLYSEAEDYYRNVRAQCAVKEKSFVRFTVARETLRAAPEMGGCGVLPPGQYEYDYSIKCDGIMGDNRRLWLAVDARLSRRHKFPGLTDLRNDTARAFSHDVPSLAVPERAWKMWEDRWRGDRASQDGRGELLRARLMAKVWSYRRRWHVDKRHRGETAYRFSHLLSAPVDVFQWCWQELKNTPGTGSVDQQLKAVSAPPAEGMLAKLWYGLGQDVIACLGPTVVESIQTSSAPGREFASEWGWLPLEMREKFLRGHLGSAGSWTKLIPSSFTPWLSQSVNFVLFRAMATGVRYRGSLWLLQVRQAITSAICRQFVAARPTLMLH